MRKLLLLILMVCMFCHTQVWANEIAVIKSSEIAPYHEAMSGFKNVCKADIKEFVLSENNSIRIVEEISKAQPALILTIGHDALLKAKTITDIPIVYMMVSNPKQILSGKKNITGVSMNISAERQLSTLLEINPQIKKIGLIYNGRKVSFLFEETLSSTSKFGVEVVSKEAHSPSEVPSLLTGMKNKIDAIWMLPDTTVINKELVEYLLLFSFENNIPILAFSDKYVAMGALMALSIDAWDIGRQAGEMANDIISGIDVNHSPINQPRKAMLSINRKTAKKFGININEKIIQKSEKIY